MTSCDPDPAADDRRFFLRHPERRFRLRPSVASEPGYPSAWVAVRRVSGDARLRVVFTPTCPLRIEDCGERAARAVFETHATPEVRRLLSLAHDLVPRRDGRSAGGRRHGIGRA
jgi:hypothetical protein